MARYDLTRYWATHNSYEGKTRGSVPSQLARNVRCIEFDIWANDYERFGDFRLGHFKPGHSVALGTGAALENPTTLFLADWLKTIASWSAGNPGHAALTLVLDAKSDLTGNDQAGDLEDLNQKIENAFGAGLYTRDDFDADGGWPDTTRLRNRVICVLSGNTNTRASYRYCFGERPAIAVNADGRVALAYRSSAGDMRCWVGQARPRLKRVDWERRDTYAVSAHTVSEPSLAVTDDGWVISVYRIGPAPGRLGPALLESRVGELGDDGRIDWHDADTFARGLLPSLELTGANKLRLIHTTDSGRSLRLREGTLNRTKGKIEWKDSVPTPGPAFPCDAATWKGQTLRALTDATGIVFCDFAGSQAPVRYRQLAFVELQSDEDEAALVDPVFFGCSASDRDAIAAARNAGFTARAWWFKDRNRASPPSPPQENFAATDNPFDAWYAPYMAAGAQTEV